MGEAAQICQFRAPGLRLSARQRAIWPRSVQPLTRMVAEPV
eukprot:CAMPEP_0195104620 /NCGR_PEP_ID=MMETSP0448-20130528/73211_1 /TAXON_ID=66468 /ORGANISM="Heterocapsa triquestra, Strain CCMP 448" /LENGTH=40 /DNA_ID= /DNA_START= /DNA_END= /DNA_ORIENTATION=